MDDSGPKLASDLEWMLQSGQASPSLIAEALVEAHFPSLFQMANFCLNDRDLSAKIARETLVFGMNNADRFDPDAGVQSWLLAHALARIRRNGSRGLVGTLQKAASGGKPSGADASSSRPGSFSDAFDSLPAVQRLPLFLQSVCQLTSEEIIMVLGTTGSQASQRLASAERRLQGWLQAAGEAEMEVHQRVQAEVEARWPVPSLSEEEKTRLLQRVLADAARSASRRSLGVRIREAAIAGLALLAIGALLWTSNRLSPSPPPTPPRTVIVTEIVRVAVEVTLTPTLRGTPTPEVPPALSQSSPPEEITERMRSGDDLWETLWVEAQILDFSLPGSPRVRREQIWVQQPHRALVVTGPLGNEPDQVWLTAAGRVYDVNLESGAPAFYDVHDEMLPVYSSLESMIFPAELLPRAGPMAVVGEERVAGRNAVVVDWDFLAEPGTTRQPEPARMWVDVETGVVLRFQQYAGDGGGLLREMQVTGIVYDFPFDYRVFDRTGPLTHFARDPAGEPLLPDAPPPTPRSTPSVGHRPAPPGFDPADSPLVFHWTGKTRYGEPVPVTVFVGGHALGTLQLQDPGNTVCERSPDGRWLAYISYSDQIEELRAALHYARLDALEEIKTIPPVLNPESPFAFSPEGRWLAFLGCQTGSSCSVVLWSLQAGEVVWEQPAAGVKELAWSPGGTHLAVLSDHPGSLTDHLGFIEVESGRVVYSGEYHPARDHRQADAPDLTWFSEFPHMVSTLEGCARPPEG